VLLTVGFGSEAAADRSKPTSGSPALVLVAPSEAAQKIQLEPLVAKGGGYIGHLTVTVKNQSAKPGSVSVEYLQGNGARFDALAGVPASPVEPATPIADPPPLRPGQVRPLQLEFALPKGKSANWLNGTLLLRLRKIGTKGTGPAPTLISVQAEFLSLTDIRFDPSDLTLQVTGGDLKGGTDVDLVGPGVDQLLDQSPPFEAQVLLGNDEGNRAQVTIGAFRSSGEGVVTGTVSVIGAEPGRYEGTLTLAQGSAPPKLPIALNSRSCLWLAVGLILLGSLLGGLLPIFSSTARTRALLRTRLKTAIERLEEQYDSADNRPLLLWDMTGLMGPEPWLSHNWSSIPEAEGAAGLYAELKWARNDDDLKALGAKVEEAIAEIDRWLLVFERAKELRSLLSRPGIPMRHGTEWEATRTATDGEEFLDGLRRDKPENAKRAHELAVECIERRRWCALVMEAWTKVARAETDPELSEVARIALGQIDLSPFTSVAFPASGEIAGLVSRLATEMRRATRLVPTLDRYADRPDLGTLDTFLASASLPDVSHPDLMAGVVAESEELADKERISARKRAGEQRLQRLSALDWLVTGILAVGATFAYTVPLYNSTWGTKADLFTALAVGFGTQVVVQWGAMPIFRSFRAARQGGDAPAPAKA
jgi:hypothetical protein